MSRGRSFSPLEEAILRDNYDLTTAELESLLRDSGYFRSRKSINRKIEKMREEGKIGLRSKGTIKRSYRQRTKKSTRCDSKRVVDDPFGPSVSWDELVQED